MTQENRDYRRTSDAFLARLDERMLNIEKITADILKKLDEKYVTQEEFRPVKLLVFGFTGLILTSVIGSLLYLVVK